MSYIIDFLFVAICALIVFGATKRGFVLAALEFAFSFLGTAIAWTLAAALCDDIYVRFVRDRILSYLDNSLLPGIENVASADVNAVLAAIPEPIRLAAANLGIISDEAIQVDLSGVITAEKLESAFLGPIALFAVKALLFVALAVILGILLRLAARAINRLIKKSPLKSLNSLLGGVFGLLKGGILVLILALAVTAISYAFPASQFALYVSQSKICGFAVDILNSI